MPLEDDNVLSQTLVISRRLGETFKWMHDDDIEMIVKRYLPDLEFVGSGAGCGFRDLEFDGYVTKEEAKVIAEAISKHTGVDINWKLYDIVRNEIDG